MYLNNLNNTFIIKISTSNIFYRWDFLIILGVFTIYHLYLFLKYRIPSLCLFVRQSVLPIRCHYFYREIERLLIWHIIVTRQNIIGKSIIYSKSVFLMPARPLQFVLPISKSIFLIFIHFVGFKFQYISCIIIIK